ncbi:MAG: hypothetical protein HC924_14510 [Synechococcaceae cyanobacterium SM2_3_2]|nr:hypothetical protein [Synechococcaceae cyanobacterium SM2_3_2]
MIPNGSSSTPKVAPLSRDPKKLTSEVDMKPEEYFQGRKYILDDLWFDLDGIRHRGHGIMTWDPKVGFHIDAFLDKGNQPQTIELRAKHLVEKEDLVNIRLMPRGLDWAIAPNTLIFDRFQLQNSQLLSVSTHSLITCESSLAAVDETLWKGAALYKTGGGIKLPDAMRNDTIAGDELLLRQSQSGIRYKDETKFEITARYIDQNHLLVCWKVPKSSFDKARAWKLSEAIQDVLSILYGQTIWLMYREMEREGYKTTEIIKNRAVSKLGVFSLFGSHPGFKRQVIVQMIQVFVDENLQTEICRNMFRQVVESCQQKTWQAQELLISTILEAALRTLDNRPTSDDKYQVSGGTSRFRTNYLNKDWKERCNEASKVFSRLRNRNAHPDWLTSPGGGRSKEEQEKSFNDMVFLCRFYGYMILALSGFRDLNPDFPLPYEQRQPLVSIHTVPTPEDLEGGDTSGKTTPSRLISPLMGLSSPLMRLSDQLRTTNKRYEERTILRNHYKQAESETPFFAGSNNDNQNFPEDNTNISGEALEQAESYEGSS